MKARREDFHEDFFKGVAHRGLHDIDSTENSLSAFKKAIDRGMAFELDIHLTKDGRLIVCHDSSLLRTTGKEGIIEELTSKEIRENYKLLDGEDVPLLEEVLNLNNEKVTAVIELKPYKGNHKKLSRTALKAVEGIKDKRKVTFISFDPRSLIWISRKKYKRGLLLDHTRTDIMIFRNMFDYLDVDYLLLEDRRIIKYRKKNRIINCYTIKNPSVLESVKDKTDTFTFEGFIPELS